MKNLLLAAAAVATMGIGTAFADGDVATQQLAPASRTVQTQNGSFTSNGIYVSNSPRHEVWVYGAMRGPGYTQGGDN